MVFDKREQEDSINTDVLIRTAIQRINPKYQAVLAMRSAGFTQAECGLILGVTRAAIGFIYKRGIQELREVMVSNDPET